MATVGVKRTTPSSFIKKIALAIVVCFILCGSQPARAQQAQPQDERETIRQLLRRIDELEARLKAVEAKQGSASAQPAEATGAAPAPKHEDAGEQAQSGHGMGLPADSPSLRMHGFADVGYHASDLKGETNSFALGQFDLFITSRLSEKFSALAEMVIEADDRNAFGVELERFLLQYSANDYFKLAVGRFHTAIGYYNTAFHHGTWFQTATGRPFLFAFEDEGGILPIHNVGISASGRIPSGGLGLNYIAEVGNGRASRSRFDEPVQNVIDENNGKAFNVGLISRPRKLDGFQAGFTVYRDHLTPDGLPRIGQTIMAGHIVYQTPEVEFLNEALVVRHALTGSNRVFNTPGFYTQLSRRFGKARPYFRYQYVNAPGDDPIIGDVERRNGPSVGLRYDVSEFAALKIQYDRTARRNLDAINGIGFQLAFTF